MGASALIQQNAANPLQHYWIFLVGLFVFLVVFSPQALALSYAFYAFFFLTHRPVDCSSVSVALVRPEQDQPAEAEEECKTPCNKNSLLYFLHVN